MNINKLIYKSIAVGFDGNPSESNMFHIQEWITRNHNLVPAPHWSFKEQQWRGYVYPTNYDPVNFIKKIREERGCSSKEAGDMLNAYTKTKFVVKDNNNCELFMTSEEAMYWAIIKALETIKNK